MGAVKIQSPNSERAVIRRLSTVDVQAVHAKLSRVFQKFISTTKLTASFSKDVHIESPFVQPSFEHV